MTVHSAKGLEWSVVIPVGLWRRIGERRLNGLRMVSSGEGGPRVVLDSESIDKDTQRSLEWARRRELVRLLYVALTRPRTALVVPWSGYAIENDSFLWLWGLDPAALDPIPEMAAGTPGPEAQTQAPMEVEVAEPAPGPPAPAFPRRILPHQLATLPDAARAARHETSLDAPSMATDVADPLEYGIWWHETLEFMPWAADSRAVEAHGAAALLKARELGFEARGREEWDRLLMSEPWRAIRDPRWARLAEVGIFAPMPPEGWIDGVMDLVLHDSAAGELWIVDWKTNRRRVGEEDPVFLERLAADYARQLTAYGSCAAVSFPGSRIRLWVYSTVAGLWSPVKIPP
jgi:ATP-dependent exoDNAse (exonuclease V) beta subunit